ncbi:unnamed protein product [Lupinus luteus]|uniref:Uncharacterized protein n=1 Tax=Lupinus luteus TaxID=3873 RepID=A0AAV1VXF9_LUPLU
MTKPARASALPDSSSIFCFFKKFIMFWHMAGLSTVSPMTLRFSRVIFFLNYCAMVTIFLSNDSHNTLMEIDSAFCRDFLAHVIA